MAKIELIVGTTLGCAEYMAEELAGTLEDYGHQTKLHMSANLTDLDQSALWLVVSSTHGAGELPDNLQPFLAQLEQEKTSLSSVKFALCAIGDSRYDTFCLGPKNLADMLQARGAIEFVDKINIDMQFIHMIEDPALEWLSRWIGKL